MKTLSLTLAGFGLALAACAPMEGEGGNAPMTPPATDAPGQCQAQQYQSWIGRNRSELPQAPAGQTWRVTCTTCPVTMDYRADRLNILFDQQTGVVREVKCG